MSKKIFEQLLEGIAQSKTAEDLLEQIWLEVGPYQSGRISERTWRRVNNFFEFDDSE